MLTSPRSVSAAANSPRSVSSAAKCLKPSVQAKVNELAFFKNMLNFNLENLLWRLLAAWTYHKAVVQVKPDQIKLIMPGVTLYITPEVIRIILDLPHGTVDEIPGYNLNDHTE